MVFLFFHGSMQIPDGEEFGPFVFIIWDLDFIVKKINHFLSGTMRHQGILISIVFTEQKKRSLVYAKH